MNQKQQELPLENHKATSLDELKSQFRQVKSQPATRKVDLVYHIECGCGNDSDVKIRRTVPFDSDLKDGDFTDQLHLTDRLL